MGQQALHGKPERSRVLSYALREAADRLGLNRAQLASVIGLSPASVTRLYKDEYFLDEKDKSWELSALLVRLFRGLDAILAGDEQAVKAWIQNPNTDLHEAPLSLLPSVAGLMTVVNYVDSQRARV